MKYRCQNSHCSIDTSYKQNRVTSDATGKSTLSFSSSLFTFILMKFIVTLSTMERRKQNNKTSDWSLKASL